VKRPGYTLVELLVALGVGALVVGLGAMIGFRHQRFHRDVVIAVERADEIDEMVALMPISLRSIAPGEGDIAPGAARDTSLEFRATIASAVVCDSGSSTVLLAPAGVSPQLSSLLDRPATGDTAWFLDSSGATESWAARPITAVFDSSAVCRVGSSATFGLSQRASIALRLAAALPRSSCVVRVTRPWRYSLYRASDGSWYFGAKDWNASLGRFNTIQPVAGPLVSAAAGGLRFRYLDSLGAPLPVLPPDTRRIASIEVAVRVDSTIPGAYAHATSIRGRATVAIGLRNRVR
jgi:prepilin-type N-terminal cleavage/methylation domain-containing protein